MNLVETMLAAEPGEVTLCTLGPLTNVALALRRRAEAVRVYRPLQRLELGVERGHVDVVRLGPAGSAAWIARIAWEHDRRPTHHPTRHTAERRQVRRSAWSGVRRSEGSRITTTAQHTLTDSRAGLIPVRLPTHTPSSAK